MKKSVFPIVKIVILTIAIIIAAFLLLKGEETKKADGGRGRLHGRRLRRRPRGRRQRPRA